MAAARDEGLIAGAGLSNVSLEQLRHVSGRCHSGSSGHPEQIMCARPALTDGTVPGTPIRSGRSRLGAVLTIRYSRPPSPRRAGRQSDLFTCPGSPTRCPRRSRHAAAKHKLAASYQALERTYREREAVFAQTMADRAGGDGRHPLHADAAEGAQLPHPGPTPRRAPRSRPPECFGAGRHPRMAVRADRRRP
jgi:hypothetical protein